MQVHSKDIASQKFPKLNWEKIAQRHLLKSQNIGIVKYCLIS